MSGGFSITNLVIYTLIAKMMRTSNQIKVSEVEIYPNTCNEKLKIIQYKFRKPDNFGREKGGRNSKKVGQLTVRAGDRGWQRGDLPGGEGQFSGNHRRGRGHTGGRKGGRASNGAGPRSNTKICTG